MKISIATLGLLFAFGAAATPLQALPQADRLEPGKQGETPDDAVGVLAQPYRKGVIEVGHLDLKRDGNMVVSQMGRCAYVSSIPQLPIPGLIAPTPDKAGVAVIDVRDPARPRLVRVLRDAGAINAAETMDAVEAGKRRILIAGNYGGGKPGGKTGDRAWLDIYDVSDCTNPKLVTEYAWPENVHMVTLSPNGRRVYGTSIDPFTGKGGILVLDITDPAHPRYLGKFGATRPDGTTYEFATHQIVLSPDERRIYAGVIGSQGGDLNDGAKTSHVSAKSLGQDAGGTYIFDNSDIVDGRPDPKLRLIGSAEHTGWHSPVRARIKGVPYLVNSGELGTCPGAWPRITSIADERKPQVVGEFRLAMNHAENCPPWNAMEKASAGISGRASTASSHFNNVDSATDTRLGLFGMLAAGIRIADLRDPKNPVEVAYFKPGDLCASNVRYQPKTGEIWFACGHSGFYVLALRPELRASLGLPRVASLSGNR